MIMFASALKFRGIRVARLVGVLVLLLSTFTAPIQAAEMRQWQDVSGKFQVTASFKEVNADDEVVLELEDGATRNVAFDNLSTKDQAYVAKLVPDSELKPVSNRDAKAPKRKSDVEFEEDEVTNDEKWDKWGWKIAVGGLILISIGGVIVLIDAFCESVGWGLACLIIPLANLIYVATHWHRPWTSRAGMMIFLGLGLSVGSVLALGQPTRLFEKLKEASENPSDPFWAPEK